MSKKYIRMLIAWLRLIFKKAILRSQKTFFTIFRLFRCCHEVVSGGKERIFRAHGPALSSQPLNQEKSSAFVAVSLAVPLQSESSQLGTSTHCLPTSGIVDEETNDEVSDIRRPHNLALSMPCPMPMPPSPAMPCPVPMSTSPAMPYSMPMPTSSVMPEQDILVPIVPAEIKRYDRKIPVSCQYMVFEVKKGLLNYSEELPLAWQALTHPEGALFFFHPVKRVFTDADVRVPEIAAKVNRAAEKAYLEAYHEGVTLHPSVELGLEFMEDGQTGYYFADCASRAIFWFKDYRSDHLMDYVRGVEHKNHVRYAIESQYWRHIELFPNKRFLPKVEVVRLKGLTMHALGDTITSDAPLTPFTLDQIANILTLIDPLSNDVDEEHEHSVCIVARFMRLFCQSKFVNFCGQPSARLDADQPLYGDPEARPKQMIYLYHFMDIILFRSPGAYSKALHRIWVDQCVLQQRWKNFIDRLDSEWSGYMIFSTVMLAVDISFLAVPTVENQTVVLLVSYLSTVCAMGSLVVSLVLAGQVNDTRRSNDVGAALFMEQMSRSILGLEGLAVMLSMPFALLMWGMIFFGTALSILIFSTSDMVTISIAAVMWSAMLMLVIWPVLAANTIYLDSLRARILNGLMHNNFEAGSDV